MRSEPASHSEYFAADSLGLGWGIVENHGRRDDHVERAVGKGQALPAQEGLDALQPRKEPSGSLELGGTEIDTDQRDIQPFSQSLEQLAVPAANLENRGGLAAGQPIGQPLRPQGSSDLTFLLMEIVVATPERPVESRIGEKPRRFQVGQARSVRLKSLCQA